MLKELHIRNFALIESVDLNFTNGFTVFTGETGSGKSIILGALNLILGERADYGVIRDENQKTVAEALFTLEEDKFLDFFSTNDLDFSAETLVRREINSKGKSRAFINDSPVQLDVLKELTSQLIKIHSQYHTYSLKNKRFQLEILDDFLQIDLSQYKRLFSQWNLLKKKVEKLQEQLNQSNKDADYIHFQVEELKNAALSEADYSELEQQLTQLQNASEIIQQFDSVYQIIEADSGVLPILINLKNQINKSSNLHPKLLEIKERLDSLIIELKDISDLAADCSEKISIEPSEEEILTEKVNNFNRLLQKHQVSSQSELLEIYKNFLHSSTSMETLENELLEMKNELQVVENTLFAEAEKIHSFRKENSHIFTDKSEELLRKLKLENSKVIVEISEIRELNDNGKTEVNILFSPNKGSEPKPIDKAASGGELSRFMLCLERMLSEKVNLPTLILDEIDSGVSGEVALKVGQMLSEMGNTMQLFAITHLPQVAAKGSHHFKVYKTEENTVTKTFVKSLNKEERLLEIAGLMSGEKVNEAALANAKILMKS